jgi:hypothetical protein
MGVILIAGEGTQEGATPATLELVTAAGAVAGDGGTVVAAFTGAPGESAPDVPVDAVYLIEHEALGESDSGTFDAATDPWGSSRLSPGTVWQQSEMVRTWS